MAVNDSRPLKRAKLSHNSSSQLSSACKSFTKLPHPVLLLSLPALLVHPPNTRYHVQSLCLSLASIRKCLSLGSLSPEIECRAWTALAEVGMVVINGGVNRSETYPWAKNIEIEVEKGIAKGVLIAQKHPSLSAYKHHLTWLHARLSQWQHNTKFTRKLLQRLTTSFVPSDPPHLIYAAHLSVISNYITPTSSATNPQAVPASQDIHSALVAIDTFQSLSIQRSHPHVTLLSHILRLRTLIAAGMWDTVSAALSTAENALALSYDPSSGSPKPLHPSQIQNSSDPATAKKPSAPTFKSFENPFEIAMAVHCLIMAITYFTHAGNAAEASVRLSHLHTLLDSGALDKFPMGTVELPFPNGPPLSVQVTHPRVLYLLTFLVSAVSKRDAAGRKPKRKVFAAEGLAIWENEVKKEMLLPPWAGIGDTEEIEQRSARIKGDLLCEFISVSIMRSEFDNAQKNLNVLIAHTRTHDIFPLFSGRISLHHAHLAHALGQTTRALQCYQTATYVSEKDSFVRIAAQAGEFALRTGMKRKGTTKGDKDEMGENGIAVLGRDVAMSCKGQGASLEALGQVIEACLTTEILKSKQHLKQALNFASKAQDNHLRALILALISSHYFHTAQDHAQSMLETCEELAKGLGAPVEKFGKSGGKRNVSMDVVNTGNTSLRLWVGERFLELYKRAGNETEARKRELLNAQLARLTPHNITV